LASCGSPWFRISDIVVTDTLKRYGQLTARAQTWSNYKHYQILVSITGAISFVSRAFGGRTFDKVITQKSVFLDKLEGCTKLPNEIETQRTKRNEILRNEIY
jgi:hypothetical protein